MNESFCFAVISDRIVWVYYYTLSVWLIDLWSVVSGLAWFGNGPMFLIFQFQYESDNWIWLIMFDVTIHDSIRLLFDDPNPTRWVETWDLLLALLFLSSNWLKLSDLLTRWLQPDQNVVRRQIDPRKWLPSHATSIPRKLGWSVSVWVGLLLLLLLHH